MILCREEFAKKIDSEIFPGIQGGPLMHVVAGKAVAFKEALRPSFSDYQKKIVENASRLAAELKEKGYRIVSGGTDNHLMLVDLSNKGITGKTAEKSLDKAGITVNKNLIPFDSQSPFVTSGIRLGTAAATTRGIDTDGMAVIAGYIDRALNACQDDKALGALKSEVKEFLGAYPLYSGIVEEMKNA
jgi:glycine hydroxymethyltransferase